jgi:hypothetical protein
MFKDIITQPFKNQDSSISWINQRGSPFNYQTNINPRRIYFLYAFLGDGYEINKEEYLLNLKKWRKTHSQNKKSNSWIISILRREYDELDNFVKEHFHWFWLSYLKYSKNIQRCDIIRYMLMYKYGGVYSDLDVKPNMDLDILLNRYPTANVIFGIGREKPLEKCKATTKIESIRKGELEIPTRIANYFFISRIPYHPIWIDILKLAKKRANNPIKSQYGIIYTTGPDVVTTALYNNLHKYQDIIIIKYDDFKNMYPHSCSSFTDGSWRKNIPIGEKGKNSI